MKIKYATMFTFFASASALDTVNLGTTCGFTISSKTSGPTAGPTCVPDLSTLWNQLGIDLDGEAARDWSGYSVSLSDDGSRVAIGAIRNDGNGSNSGHTRIFEYNVAQTQPDWVQLGQDIDGEAAYDQFGSSVSLSGDGSRVAIGAIQNDGNGSNSGHTRIFEYDVALNWVQLGQDIDGEAANDQSGNSVSLSDDGSRVAIGADSNSGVNGSRSGHTRIYQYVAPDWVKLGQDIDGEAAYDQSGYSVSLSDDGSRVAIGAPSNDGVNGSDSGHTRIFEYDVALTQPEWVQLGQDIDGEAAYDYSGRSVSLSDDGSRVAIGAHFNDGNGSYSGHTRIFEYNVALTQPWVQLGQDINGEAAGDQSGKSVSLSGDGSRVAIGAPSNDGVNGAYSGHTRIFQYDVALTQPDWVQLGQDIDGEAAVDNSGYSVSLSGDGSRVAIGAHFNDGNGANSGHTMILEYNRVPSSC